MVNTPPTNGDNSPESGEPLKKPVKRTKKSAQLLEIKSKKTDDSVTEPAIPAVTQLTEPSPPEATPEKPPEVLAQVNTPEKPPEVSAQVNTPEAPPEASTPETVSKETVKEEKKQEIEIPPGTIFQAVGVIRGDVTFTTENEKTVASITIGAKEYPLFYAPKKQRAYDALKKEIEATGDRTQRVVVYPRFTHFPGRDQQPNVGFQLVGFDKGREEQEKDVPSKELQDLEFKLCGLWQFIPVCRTPCISIFRNFTKERLEHVKQSEPAKKVKFMKASHLPLFWRDAPVPPFRFNPKATKEEQGRPVFVQVKARFQPSRNAFEFDSLLGVPLEKPPKFLKVSKDDKATAMAEKKAADRAAGRDTRPPRSDNPPFKPRGDFKPRASSAPLDMPKPKPKPKQ
ncbi:MAG: hypothetical protein KME46_33770 [Brasilonema angustatum HA4187-MV1]|jgi:hypothetical protein|nr:hypothetical protein [Brasilonema angustatum HA4187-MV1]